MASQVSYVFSNWIKDDMDVVFTLICLLRTEDPVLTELIVDGGIKSRDELVPLLQEEETSKQWIAEIRHAQKITVKLDSSILRKFELDFDLHSSEMKVLIKSYASIEDMKEFESQLHNALITMYPDRFDPYSDEEHQPFQLSINISRGTIVFDRKFVFDQDTKYSDYQKSFLSSYEMSHSKQSNVMLQKPVHFWNRDWVCSMNFSEKVRLINMRIIMPGEDGIARYTDLDSDTEKLAFDQVVSILDRNTAMKGVKQQLDGMTCYGYEHQNVMVVDDPQQHSVSLVFMFNQD